MNYSPTFKDVFESSKNYLFIGSKNKADDFVKAYIYNYGNDIPHKNVKGSNQTKMLEIKEIINKIIVNDDYYAITPKLFSVHFDKTTDIENIVQNVPDFLEITSKQTPIVIITSVDANKDLSHLKCIAPAFDYVVVCEEDYLNENDHILPVINSNIFNYLTAAHRNSDITTNGFIVKRISQNSSQYSYNYLQTNFFNVPDKFNLPPSPDDSDSDENCEITIEI